MKYGNADNIKYGKIGEGLACEYLVKKQWRILVKNYRRKADEIDIIAVSVDKVLVFCEVKTMRVCDRRGDESLMPEDNLTSEKMRKISRACQFFARANPQLIDEERGWRIDLVAVDIGPDGRASGIRHYENV